MNYKKYSAWIVMLAVWVTASADNDESATSPVEQPSVLVQTRPLQKLSLPITLTAYGSVSLDPQSSVNISFPRAGQVSSLLVTLGQVVKSGEPLLELATDPATTLNYRQAATAVDLARSELKRTKALLSQQLATQSQVATAGKALSDAEDALKAQQNIGADLQTQTLNAPFDGVVSTLSVAQGDRIQAGAIALQLGRRDALRVELGVEPGQSSQVTAGLPVRLTPVFDERAPVDATVSEVHGMIDPQTRLVDVIVRLSGTDSGHLIAGMNVRGLITTRSEATWAVPRAAVLSDAEGSYVFQVSQDQHAHRISVQTSAENETLTGVSGALQPEQPVVVLGNYELEDGMTVRVQDVQP